MTQKKGGFSILIGILPIINAYSLSFLPRLDLGSIIVILYSLFNFLSKKTRVTVKNPLLIVYFYTLLLTPVCIIGNLSFATNIDSGGVIILLRYGKFILVSGLLLFTSLHESFDKDLLISTIQKVIYLAFVVIVIQQLSYYIWRVTFSNPFLYVFHISGGSQMDAGYVVVSDGLYRPSAFFLEPSWMAVYCIVYLSYLLFSKNGNIKDLVLTTITILLTTSGIGILFISALYISAILIKRNNFKDLLVLVVCGIVLYFFSRTTVLQATISRLLFNKSVVSGRIGAGYQIWLNLSTLGKIFGIGYGNVPPGQFINGIGYLLITEGFLGVVLWFLTIFFIFLKGVLWEKIVIVCFVGLAFGVQVFNISTILFYFSLASSHVFPFTSKTYLGVDEVSISNRYNANKEVYL